MWERQVGERIGQLRQQQKMTKAEFAEVIGISERSMTQLERGTNAITAAAISKICKITGVTADYILFGTTDPVTDVSLLFGLSREQAQITLDIVMKVFE